MLKGSCLCKAVTFEVTVPITDAPSACHCGMCRKQTGHIYVGVNVPLAALNIRGEDQLKWYASSEEVRRGFCSQCGSVMFWKPLKKGYPYISVTMGAFDGSTGLHLARHIYVADKGDYYKIGDGLPQSATY